MTTELYIEAVNSTALSFSNVLLLCSDKLKDGEEPEPADSQNDLCSPRVEDKCSSAGFPGFRVAPCLDHGGVDQMKSRSHTCRKKPSKCAGLKRVHRVHDMNEFLKTSCVSNT